MHHSRRKSGHGGHGSANTSLTDVRKAVNASDLNSSSARHRPSRPAPMIRRNTPQTSKLGKNPRDREREWEEERWWDEERESFPQYWYVLPECYLFTLDASPRLDDSTKPSSDRPLVYLLSFPNRLFLFRPLASSPDVQVNWDYRRHTPPSLAWLPCYDPMAVECSQVLCNPAVPASRHCAN
jgi:hypothetical protein